MATTLTLYNHVSEHLFKGHIPFDTAAFKLALTDTQYTFAGSHTTWTAHGEPYEISTTGSNYTAGGKTLSQVTVTRSSATTTFDANTVSWASATFTTLYGILYANATLGGVAKPMVGAILFDDSGPTPVTVSGVAFQVIWHANGIITLGP